MCDTEDVPKKSNNDENGEKPIQAVFNLNTKEETMKISQTTVYSLVNYLLINLT